MDKLSVTTASQAGSKLLRLFGIITLDSDNHSILDMELEWASSAAIMGGRSSYNHRVTAWLGHLFTTHINLLRVDSPSAQIVELPHSFRTAPQAL
jgi:hypothetical protein